MHDNKIFGYGQSLKEILWNKRFLRRECADKAENSSGNSLKSYFDKLSRVRYDRVCVISLKRRKHRLRCIQI